jgi:hypothetical protein
MADRSGNSVCQPVEESQLEVVIYRSEPALGIMSTLKLLLVESEGIPRGLGQSVTDALGARIVSESGSIKTRGSFGRRLLGNQRERDNQDSRQG